MPNHGPENTKPLRKDAGIRHFQAPLNFPPKPTRLETMRKILLLLFALIALGASPLLVRPVQAGCSGFSLGCCSSCSGCGGIGPGQCKVSNNTVTTSESCPQPGGGYCVDFYTCDTSAEARAICTDTGTGSCTGSCSPRVAYNSSTGLWTYQGIRTSGQLDWVPRPTRVVIPTDRDCGPSCDYSNYYGPNGPEFQCITGWRTGGQCGVAYFDICERQTQDTCAGTLDEYWGDFRPCIWYDNNVCGPQKGNLAGDFASGYYYGANANSNCRAFTLQGGTCGQGICDTACAYRDPLNAWQYFTPDPACNVSCPNSCTITVSPTSIRVSSGRSQSATATVTNIVSGGTLQSVSWSSANSSIATAGSPGNPTLVTGVAAGSTTVTARANIAITGGNSGYCDSSPITVSVIPPSFFQTFGGDVTAKGNITNPSLPSGKYISAN